METAPTFGNWIRRRRRALDLTQEALAERLGYSVASLRKIESGERRASRQIAERLADVLDIAPEARAAFIAAARRDPDLAAGVDLPSLLVASPAASAAPAVTAPAAPFLAPSPAGIPADVSSFIGRERETASLVRLLQRPGVRLVTLVGPPGIGKTRLALRVAESLCDDYPDGAAYIDLLPASGADQVAAVVAAALGVREEPDRTLLQTVQEYLRTKHILLVLDNFEQAIQAAPVVTALLSAAAGAKALVTSRIILDLRGEHVFNVPPLTSPDLLNLTAGGDALVALLETYEAVQLFVERSQARAAEFELTPENARPVAELCRLLDGLPLAIELAAARVADQPPDVMLTEMTANRLNILHGTARDAPRRQQTLRGAIEWSHDRLPEALQRLWRRLSVFKGGFTLQAAQALCVAGRPTEATSAEATSAEATSAEATSAEATSAEAVAPDEVEVGLASLIKENLAWRATAGGGAPGAPARYYQLPVIQEYGRERLDQSGEAELIRRRHAEFYAAQAEYARTIQPNGEGVYLDFLDQEHANLNAALDWCAAGSATDLELRMALELTQYWEARGYLSEGRAHLERIVAGRDLPRDTRLSVVKSLGMLSFRQGDIPAARRYVEEELALRRAAGDPFRIAQALLHVGYVLIDAGDIAGARACSAEGQALCRAQGWPREWAHFTNNLGDIARLEDDYDLAEALYLESLEVFRQSTEPRPKAWALQNLGYTARRRGAYAQARAYLEEGLEIFEDVGNPHGVAACLAGLAYLAVNQGQAETAALLFGASEALRQSAGAEYQAADAAEVERGLAAARAALSPAEFDALWAAGRRMSVADALERARRT